MKIAYVASSGQHFIDPLLAAMDCEPVNLATPMPDGTAKVTWPVPSDVLFIEWCDGAAVQLSRAGKTKPIVIRFHSFELFSPFPGQVNWQNVDAVVFVAEHVRDRALAKWPQIAESTKVVVIPNGVDFERFPPADHEETPKRVGWAGGISGKKDPPKFLEVAAAIRARDPEYTFHVAGEFQDERYVAYFDEQLPALGLADAVQFYGQLPPDKMPGWWASMGYVLSTSPWESFQHAVAEGIASGALPLVHSWPGVGHVYPGVVPWVTVEGAVARLAEYDGMSPEYRRRYVQNLRADIVGRYSLPDVARRMDVLLAEVVASPAIYPTVGAIMIVTGDAGLDFQQCLDSIKDHVDSVTCCVDTRSGDQALTIASQYPMVTCYTDPPPLYMGPEEIEGGRLDFSAARNRSIERCEADWCFVIDSDEVWKGNVNLRMAARQADLDGFDSIAVRVDCMTSGGQPCSRCGSESTVAEEAMDIRAFRRSSGIHWEYPVHNQLTGVRNTMGTPGVIRSSYEGTIAGKCSRTIPMLEKLYQEFSDAKNEEGVKHAAFFLCRMHAAANDHEQVVRWAEVCREICPRDVNKAPFWRWWALSKLIQGDTEGAEEVLRDARSFHPDFADLDHAQLAIDVMRWNRNLTGEGAARRVQTPMASRRYHPNIGTVIEALGLPIAMEQKP